MGTDTLHGHAHELAALVGYQAGAIVSKILLKQPKGSVTLFAFDQGQELSEHTVPHDALVYILDGEAELTISGTPHHLNTGHALILPGHQPHAVRASRRFKMMLTMLRP